MTDCPLFFHKIKMEIIREIRNIDSDKVTIKVPKEFRKKRVEILVIPIGTSEKEETVSEDVEVELNASGLCGLWEDERNSEKIIDDIYSHRTGFGNRQVKL
jgi:hypothetical protein